jgi:hypothetical protein
MVVKIVGKCILLIAIVFLIVEATIFFSPFKEKDLETDFVAAIIDKHQILNATPSPKIILIGGSSVAYGIDSQLMQDSLGIPVVNMSFQYFLGSDFLFRQLLNSLNKGDKIISSFEYIVTKDGDKKEQLKAASYLPKANDWIIFETPDEHISAWLRSRIAFFRKIILRLYDQTPYNPTIEDKTNTFFRGAIDKNGDLVSHLNNNPIQFPLCNTAQDSSFYTVIENVEYYTKSLETKGIDVLYTFPPYEEASFNNDNQLIDRLYRHFEKYPEIKLLDSPYDGKFPNHYFQDMCYHLNAEGRKQRTLKLIQNFKSTELENAI